jgi:hypothetical protein
MSAFDLLDDAVDTLREYGLAAEIEPGKGSHLKIRFTNAHGSKCLLVVPRTSANNWRAIRNHRAALRRLMRRPAR